MAIKIHHRLHLVQERELHRMLGSILHSAATLAAPFVAHLKCKAYMAIAQRMIWSP